MEPSGRSSSNSPLFALTKITRSAPAVIIAAVALGAYSDIGALINNADVARLLALLQSTCEISIWLMLTVALAVGIHLLYSFKKQQKRRVFVVDFAVHKPDPSWTFPRAALRDLCTRSGKFTPEDIDFQEKIAFRTGLGDHTAVCPAIQTGSDDALGIEPARFEFGATCFTSIAELFNKTGVQPNQVKFVITNSSLFNPTPSLSSAIINHFKMGTDTMNYSLGGMGCSAGVQLGHEYISHVNGFSSMTGVHCSTLPSR
eukprot:GHUV01038341.1.p1 GENE.GHUV01038341.1~~GHUV01038341.1.p1  ORF type:complete len:258 (+),score=61.35 GHUV01038341.1:354-1127(+)